MPCLEISLPKMATEKKRKLAAALTEAFCSSTGHDASIFGVRFFEYDPDCAANGGVLVSDSGSPFVHFLLYCPRLKRESKQKLAESLTNAFTMVTEQPDSKPVIHICEHPYDNVVVDGRLLSDAFAECASRQFYYDLPKD